MLSLRFEYVGVKVLIIILHGMINNPDFFIFPKFFCLMGQNTKNN